jgi:hypothetical protein
MKQERKFPLAEVHTKMRTMGEGRLNQAFLDVLGVKPGDFLVFTGSKEGEVTVSVRTHKTNLSLVCLSPQPASPTPGADEAELSNVSVYG